MKQVEVKAYDDLDWTEKQQRNPATATVALGVDGRWVELDLTQDHATELLRFVDRYMTAGTKPAKPPVLRSASSPLAGARRFGKERLAWVNANGWPEVTTRYIPMKARQAYDAHLLALTQGGGDQ